MNAIVVVGLAIGVAALFFDWYSILHGGSAGHRSGASFVDGLSVGMGFWSTIANLGFAMGLFAIGLVISVITPLGALAQWAAVILASISVRGYESPQAELGLVLGLASSVTIVVGMLVPIWIPRGSGQSPRKPRLLTFSFRPHEGMLRNDGQTQYHTLARDLTRRILDNVNVMCLAGAFLGLIAVVPGLYGNEFDVDLSFSELMPNGLMFFLIGTLLAFATPWAGFIQMFGFITYALSVSSWYSGPHLMIVYHWVTLDVNLAVISSLIVTSSIFLKIDSGGSRSDKMVHRIVTWRAGPFTGERHQGQGFRAGAVAGSSEKRLDASKDYALAGVAKPGQKRRT